MDSGYLDICVQMIKTAIEACLAWFSMIMDKTGMLPLYFAGVFIVFAVGFLLSRFGNAVGPGSDLAADMLDRPWTARRRGTILRPGPRELPGGRGEAPKRISRKG